MRHLTIVILLLSGCGPMDTTASDLADDGLDDGKADSATSLKMPKAIVTFEHDQGWGMHHVQWHTERRWDLLDPSDQQLATQHGWARAAKQEGTAGNGLEFLMMHRAMLQILREKFPQNASLFAGWETPPADPRDPKNPLPGGATTPFDDHMLDAISKLETDLGSFKSEDEFGRYLETALRPTGANPGNHASDKSAGLHNYLHNRFMNPSSSINVGDPKVNLENKLFWRLHGWIDARWTAYRAAKGLSDKDPAYIAALQQAKDHMLMHMKGTVGGPCCCCPDDPIPAGIVAALKQE